MPKKKQEMSQVYSQNNEFIFGEKGGKGKNLLSFLKNLSLTGSPSSLLRQGNRGGDAESLREVNSNIYGNLSYGIGAQDHGGGEIGQRPMMASRGSKSSRSISASQTRSSTGSHDGTDEKQTSRLSSPFTISRAVSGSGYSPRNAYRRPTYTDLDDDWDAAIDEVNLKNSRIKPPKQEHLASLSSEERRSSSTGVVDSLYPELTMSSGAGASLAKELMDSQDKEMKNEIQKLNSIHTRFSKFQKVLAEDDSGVNMRDLRKLAWNGIPSELRALCWQLLLGYLPTNKTRQSSTLKRKRQEYLDGLKDANAGSMFDGTVTPSNESSGLLPASNNRDNSLNKEKQLHHQIKIDVKRTNPSIKLFGYDATQRSLRKVLYLWAIRHPASGYVQGINDLCTPFYQIFLSNYIWQLQLKKAFDAGHGDDPSSLFIPGLIDETGSDTFENEILLDPQLPTFTWENFDSGKLSPRVTAIIEADTYWCLSRLLDNITDNYIHEQPGIIRQVNDLRNLISKIDVSLLEHLESEGVEFIQFAFRWMNCLLMRELSIGLIVRMWDTYLSETPLGFNNFHVYVCAAFLIKFTNELKQKDFQEILLFLQNPPTSVWTEKDVELMLSEAFIWQSLYKNATAHLR